MKMKMIWRNVALMIMFVAIGLTLFTENVRTVQIIGLFVCGVGVGASLAQIIAAIKGRYKQA